MKKNRIMICGRNVTMLPTPPMAPSVIKSRRSPAGMCCCTQSARSAVWLPIQSIGACAKTKMETKSAVMTVPSTSQPQTGWVTTASILSEVVGPTVPARSTTSEASWPMDS